MPLGKLKEFGTRNPELFVWPLIIQSLWHRCLMRKTKIALSLLGMAALLATGLYSFRNQNNHNEPKLAPAPTGSEQTQPSADSVESQKTFRVTGNITPVASTNW